MRIRDNFGKEEFREKKRSQMIRFQIEARGSVEEYFRE